MAEYLSKEEIKQWRSSLEKITLEEFAARLGKKVEQKKETNDLIDIVFHGKAIVSDTPEPTRKIERLSSIADRAYEREKEIFLSPFSAQKLKSELTTEKEEVKKPEKVKTTKSVKTQKVDKAEKIKTTTKKTKTASKKVAETTEKKVKAKSTVKKTATKAIAKAKEAIKNTNTEDKLKNEVRLTFKKALTDREQKVFDYFVEHKNSIVYAKDLASLLELPRDYVYKYIKNLRAKIDGENLQNADKGGFVLNI